MTSLPQINLDARDLTCWRHSRRQSRLHCTVQSDVEDMRRSSAIIQKYTVHQFLERSYSQRRFFSKPKRISLEDFYYTGYNHHKGGVLGTIPA